VGDPSSSPPSNNVRRGRAGFYESLPRAEDRGLIMTFCTARRRAVHSADRGRWVRTTTRCAIFCVRRGQVSVNSQAVLIQNSLPKALTASARNALSYRWTAVEHGARVLRIVTTRRKRTGIEVLDWRAGRRAGAGELVVNSIDADGTPRRLRAQAHAHGGRAVSVPVAASVARASCEDMYDVPVRGRLDAALAASIFHFVDFTVGDTNIPG